MLVQNYCLTPTLTVFYITLFKYNLIINKNKQIWLKDSLLKKVFCQL